MFSELLENVKSISTDSRDIAPGDLFIAIQGDNFDGHNFVADVIERGAAAAIVSRLVPGVPAEKQIVVPDTRIAYLQIGNHIRTRINPRVVALTGSAGKTTTKEMLKFVLSKFARVHATAGNFNNSIGVAKTLCAMPADTEIAVIEMGMNHANEIALMSPYVSPDIAIITNIYPMHLENFADITGIARAKSEIFDGLKHGGTAVLNSGSDCYEILQAAARAKADKIITFDIADRRKLAEFFADASDHQALNALCVLAVVAELGLDADAAAVALADFQPLPGRGKIHKLSLPAGGEYTLIDDSYSAQPESLKIAIRNLDKIEPAGLPAGALAKVGRKIAVIGKMAEIGDRSAEFHREIGRVLSDTKIDIIVGVCPETKDILAELRPDQTQYYFENNDNLENFLTGELLQDGDTVLVKGSHYGSKLHQTVAKLMRN